MLILNSQCSPQKSAGLDNQYNPLNPHMSDSWTSVQPTQPPSGMLALEGHLTLWTRTGVRALDSSTSSPPPNP